MTRGFSGLFIFKDHKVKYAKLALKNLGTYSFSPLLKQESSKLTQVFLSLRTSNPINISCFPRYLQRDFTSYMTSSRCVCKTSSKDVFKTFWKTNMLRWRHLQHFFNIYSSRRMLLGNNLAYHHYMISCYLVWASIIGQTRSTCFFSKKDLANFVTPSIITRFTFYFTYKDRQLNVKLWWVEASKSKKRTFFVPFLLSFWHQCFTPNTLSEYTYFYISKKISYTFFARF